MNKEVILKFFNQFRIIKSLRFSLIRWRQFSMYFVCRNNIAPSNVHNLIAHYCNFYKELKLIKVYKLDKIPNKSTHIRVRYGRSLRWWCLSWNHSLCWYRENTVQSWCLHFTVSCSAFRFEYNYTTDCKICYLCCLYFPLLYTIYLRAEV